MVSVSREGMKEVRLWILPPSELEKKTFTAKIVREGIMHPALQGIIPFAAALKISKCGFAPGWHKLKPFRTESVL